MTSFTSFPYHTTIVAALLLSIIFLILRRVLRSQPYPSPPGPRGLPFIGNLFDWPQGYDWLYWVKHKELYGPISRAHVLGRDVIIINDADIAMDLLDKRSLVYSDRPRMIFTRELVGWKDMLAVVEYGDTFRTERKYLHQVFGTQKAISKFYPLQDIAFKRCMLNLIKDQGDLEHNVRLAVGSTILKATYGYSVGAHSDPLVKLANTADRAFVASVQNSWAVDTLPILRWLPEWLPGAGFHQIGKLWQKATNELMEVPMEFVRARMAEGNSYPSFVQSHLEASSSAYEEHVVKMAAASLYAGGSDTTVSVMLSYFLVITMFPHIQIKVHEEIDRVIGSDRLPTHQDREQLPYLDAVLKELLRWGTVVPMGIPHAASKDDVYGGYFIRKGSLVWPNIWHFLNDPDRYPNPETFLPERHMHINGNEPEPDPRLFCFGFGRRICPGKEMADSSAFIFIALAAAVLNVSRKRDASGNEIIPEKRMTGGGVSHPEPFPCVITARTSKAEALIEAANEEQPMEASDAVYLPKVIQEQYC